MKLTHCQTKQSSALSIPPIRHFSRGLLGALLLGLCGSSAQAGNIAYPALGNFDTREGTVEVWFTPMVDPYPENPGRFTSVFSLWSIEVENEFRIESGWGSSAGGAEHKPDRHRLFYSMTGKFPQALLSVNSEPQGWKKGEPQHVALTWHGHEMACYVNGERVEARLQAGTLGGLLGDTEFILGNRRGQDAGIIVHALRISSKARTEEDMNGVHPRADIYTLLFDDFTDPEDFRDGQTHPEVITSFDGRPTVGKTSGEVSFVDAPQPGLRL